MNELLDTIIPTLAVIVLLFVAGVLLLISLYTILLIIQGIYDLIKSWVKS